MEQTQSGRNTQRYATDGRENYSGRSTLPFAGNSLDGQGGGQKAGRQTEPISAKVVAYEEDTPFRRHGFVTFWLWLILLVQVGIYVIFLYLTGTGPDPLYNTYSNIHYTWDTQWAYAMALMSAFDIAGSIQLLRNRRYGFWVICGASFNILFFWIMMNQYLDYYELVPLFKTLLLAMVFSALSGLALYAILCIKKEGKSVWKDAKRIFCLKDVRLAGIVLIVLCIIVTLVRIFTLMKA